MKKVEILKLSPDFRYLQKLALKSYAVFKSRHKEGNDIVSTL